MIFHPLPFVSEVSEQLNNPFSYEPDALSLQACRLLQAQLPSSPKEGKMYGVLVGERNGQIGYLQAYSGQMETTTADFVPAVFDYLQPDGYFKIHEREISNINVKIRHLQENEAYRLVCQQLKAVANEAKAVIDGQKARIKEAKRVRDLRRAAKEVTAEEEAEMVKESRFLKAELHRTKLFYKQKAAKAQAETDRFEQEIACLQRERKLKSDQLQAWLFRNFVFLNGKGEQKDLLSIFHDYAESSLSFTERALPAVFKNLSYRAQPPSGAGECCEPKLLQYAFAHGIKPVRMAMFWWGPSPKQEIREHLHFYPACNGKCKPILSWMLEGLEVATAFTATPKDTRIDVLFEDDYLAVIEKPAGLLTVPGKDRQPSVYSILAERWADKCVPYIVHRLDMDTSGLLVVAKDQATYRHLQQQFIHRTVRKRYTAFISTAFLSSGKLHEGVVALPLASDTADRPRQMVDYEHGKPAETYYKIAGKVRLPSENNQEFLKVFLFPKTGRTHQLRIHCAHKEGLNSPIIGDNLYGTRAGRLHLYAESLSFIHPNTLKRMEFHTQEHPSS